MPATAQIGGVDESRAIRRHLCDKCIGETTPVSGLESFDDGKIERACIARQICGTFIVERQPDDGVSPGSSQVGRVEQGAPVRADLRYESMSATVASGIFLERMSERKIRRVGLASDVDVAVAVDRDLICKI